MAFTPVHNLPYPGPADLLGTIPQYSDDLAHAVAPKLPLAWGLFDQSNSTYQEVSQSYACVLTGFGHTPDFVSIEDNRVGSPSFGMVFTVIVKSMTGPNGYIAYRVRRADTGAIVTSNPNVLITVMKA